MDTEKTKVVFRRFRDDRKAVIALFPEIPATSNPWECSSYMHAGQHGAASLDLIRDTDPASGPEVAALAAELASLGYNLDTRKRITYAMHETRRKTMRGENK